MRRIGVLMALPADDPQGQARLVAFVQALQEAGWTDRRNVGIDTRWAAGDADRFRKYNPRRAPSSLQRLNSIPWAASPLRIKLLRELNVSRP